MSKRSMASRASQLSFTDMCPVTEAVSALASAGVEERGAIFTKREVVHFLLDLVGYTSDRALPSLRLLEPSFGDGDFLLPAIGRLLAAADRLGIKKQARNFARSIFAVELHTDTFEKTFKAVVVRLQAWGMVKAEAVALASAWLHRGDYLLQQPEADFDCVVGNPPYVRQELIPDALMAEYRARFSTIYDRADLYVPFIEHSLRLLKPGACVGFICADRWMKNKYGGPLRKFVADEFHMRVFVDMVDTPAFLSDVIAYPAITVICREEGNTTRVARRPKIDEASLATLAKILVGKKKPTRTSGVLEINKVAAGSEPWILEDFDKLAVVRRLEAEFPAIEDAGCKVGIGVATGADQSFIGRLDELDVEPDRKLPLVMTRDILNGHVEWRGYGVINPFKDDGGLVDLRAYPRLRAYLEERKPQISKRHVAEKSPANWYRTIDRIYPALAKKKKLLIPDIKGEAHIVYEGGKLYPHHNLYFITSDEWDLRALQAVLLSGIARLFVATYSTRMRGGYLRFQAQYLRRIRLPRWADVPKDIKKRLIDAAKRADATACNQAAAELYRLSSAELKAISEGGA